MYKNESFFVRDFVGIGFGIADGIAFENNACIGSLGSGDLRKGRTFRHNDGRCDPQALRVAGDALRVTPRRNFNEPVIFSCATCFNFTNAPRSLKDLVRCCVSSFKKISAASASVRPLGRTIGVRMNV